jgi:hypothetical protein
MKEEPIIILEQEPPKEQREPSLESLKSNGKNSKSEDSLKSLSKSKSRSNSSVNSFNRKGKLLKKKRERSFSSMSRESKKSSHSSNKRDFRRTSYQRRGFGNNNNRFNKNNYSNYKSYHKDIKADSPRKPYRRQNEMKNEYFNKDPKDTKDTHFRLRVNKKFINQNQAYRRNPSHENKNDNSLERNERETEYPRTYRQRPTKQTGHRNNDESERNDYKKRRYSDEENNKITSKRFPEKEKDQTREPEKPKEQTEHKDSISNAPEQQFPVTKISNDKLLTKTQSEYQEAAQKRSRFSDKPMLPPFDEKTDDSYQKKRKSNFTFDCPQNLVKPSLTPEVPVPSLKQKNEPKKEVISSSPRKQYNFKREERKIDLTIFKKNEETFSKDTSQEIISRKEGEETDNSFMIINVSGKKKIIINKEKKPDIKIVKKDNK